MRRLRHRWVFVISASITLVALFDSACSSFDSGTQPGGELVKADADTRADGGDDDDHGFVASPPCSSAPMTAWAEPRRMTELVGEDQAIYFEDPFITADGSTLLLDKLVGASWTVYRSTLVPGTTTRAFTKPVPQAGIATPSYSRPYPAAATPDEIVVSLPVGGASLEIGAATRSGTDRFDVSPFDELNRPDTDLWPSLSADGVMLVYMQLGANPSNPFRTIYQAQRAAPLRTSPWGDKHEVFEMDVDKTSLPAGIEYPALTPDGLGLFYTTKDDPRAYFVARTKRSDPFFRLAPSSSSPTSSPVLLESLSRAGSATRVRSMTADGCFVYLTSDRDGVADSYVATRLR